MGGHAASCFEFEEEVPRRFCLREFGIHAGHVKFLHIVGYNKYFDVFFSSSEQECLSCMGQLSIRIKFNFANSIFSGSSTERGQVGIFGCLLTPWPGGSTRVCSCCLPGGRHGYRRSSLAGGSHSSWREFDVHGENVLSGLGRAAYLNRNGISVSKLLGFKTF